MAVDASTLLFFDSSVLIAAAGSSTGGSSFLLEVAARGFLRAAVSQAVLAEAEGNILSNLPDPALTRYQQQILTMPLIIVSIPTQDERQATAPVAGDKDAHVLAAALALQAPLLITLDKRLLRAINRAKLAVRALTPGEFITSELTTHPAYRSIR